MDVDVKEIITQGLKKIKHGERKGLHIIYGRDKDIAIHRQDNNTFSIYDSPQMKYNLDKMEVNKYISEQTNDYKNIREIKALRENDTNEQLYTNKTGQSDDSDTSDASYVSDTDESLKSEKSITDSLQIKNLLPTESKIKDVPSNEIEIDTKLENTQPINYDKRENIETVLDEYDSEKDGEIDEKENNDEIDDGQIKGGGKPDEKDNGEETDENDSEKSIEVDSMIMDDIMTRSSETVGDKLVHDVEIKDDENDGNDTESIPDDSVSMASSENLDDIANLEDPKNVIKNPDSENIVLSNDDNFSGEINKDLEKHIDKNLSLTSDNQESSNQPEVTALTFEEEVEKILGRPVSPIIVPSISSSSINPHSSPHSIMSTQSDGYIGTIATIPPISQRYNLILYRRQLVQDISNGMLEISNPIKLFDGVKIDENLNVTCSDTYCKLCDASVIDAILQESQNGEKISTCMSNYCRPKHSVKVTIYDKNIPLNFDDPTRPENVEALILVTLFKDFVLSHQTPHIILPVAHFSCGKSVSHPEVKVLITEFANGGNLNDEITSMKGRLSDDNDPVISQIIFQAIYTLASIQNKYPAFRHNDLHIRNWLIQKFKNSLNGFFIYIFKGKIFALPASMGFRILMWDFDWSNLPPLYNNWKINNDPYSNLNGISSKSNRYYDIGFFITSLYFILIDNEIQFGSDLNSFFQHYAVAPEDRANYEDKGMMINTLRPASHVIEITTANDLLNNDIFSRFIMNDSQLIELENENRVIAKYVVY